MRKCWSSGQRRTARKRRSGCEETGRERKPDTGKSAAAAEGSPEADTDGGGLHLFLIPLTIAGGLWAGSRWYLPVSLLVLAETMAPFFLIYENRRPKAREIVMLALLSALTVMGNLLSFTALPIQAGTAMVILSGISFGPEAGFLVGALARFVCNFFQGQGAWTPWQMFCWGLLGFLAGLAFAGVQADRIKSRNFTVVLGPVVCVIAAEIAAYLSYLLFPGGDTSFWGWRLYVFGAAGLLAGVLLQRKRLPADEVTLGIFTFLTVFIVYGGIMNISTLVTGAAFTAEGFSWEQLKVLYLTGVPFDLLHAFRATVFMVLFGNPIIRKLERIKIKYGFYRV